jgi:FtsZ-interacting cell division protein YlmF
LRNKLFLESCNYFNKLEKYFLNFLCSQEEDETDEEEREEKRKKKEKKDEKEKKKKRRNRSRSANRKSTRSSSRVPLHITSTGGGSNIIEGDPI